EKRNFGGSHSPPSPNELLTLQKRFSARLVPSRNGGRDASLFPGARSRPGNRGLTPPALVSTIGQHAAKKRDVAPCCTRERLSEKLPLTTIYSQATLQLFRQLLPASSGQLHGLPGRG